MEISEMQKINLKISSLPETGYLRLSQILGNKKAIPPIAPLIPIGKSSWWEGVKNGRFPKSVKLGARITLWRVEDILDLIKNPNRVNLSIEQERRD